MRHRAGNSYHNGIAGKLWQAIATIMAVQEVVALCRAASNYDYDYVGLPGLDVGYVRGKWPDRGKERKNSHRKGQGRLGMLPTATINSTIVHQEKTGRNKRPGGACMHANAK